MPRTEDGGWLLDDSEIEPLTKEDLKKEEKKK